MTKKNKKNVQNQQNGQNNEFCNFQHVQLGGMAYYDESKYFQFLPSDSKVDCVQRFRLQGVAQQMTDGTFDFVAKPQRRPQSQLIKKVAHGRVSKTKDGAIQLTLKVFGYEKVNIPKVLIEEAKQAADAVEEYQLKNI